jgi:hypothetical protein
LAEEVISTIRTAQAFGTQKTLSIIYDSYVEQSLQVNLTASAWSGAGFGVTFFIIYSAYALSKLSENCDTSMFSNPPKHSVLGPPLLMAITVCFNKSSLYTNVYAVFSYRGSCRERVSIHLHRCSLCGIACAGNARCVDLGSTESRF